MKKLAAVILAGVMCLAMGSGCWADVDLSGMSYEELVALKEQIDLAIWNSAEWEEVEVPQGIWTVGEDIPAGQWTITAGDGCYTVVKLGKEIDSTGTELASYSNKWLLKSESRSSFGAGDTPTTTVQLYDGDVLWIDDGSLIFTPYAGKQSLGFGAKKDSGETATEAAAEETKPAATAAPTAAPAAAAGTPTKGESNALRSAQSYLSFMPFSYSGLKEQLLYEGYSDSEATYAADNCGADWMEQAAESAENYLSFMAFSKSSLIEQLQYEGFTYEQALYGAEANGY